MSLSCSFALGENPVTSSQIAVSTATATSAKNGSLRRSSLPSGRGSTPIAPHRKHRARQVEDRRPQRGERRNHHGADDQRLPDSAAQQVGYVGKRVGLVVGKAFRRADVHERRHAEDQNDGRHEQPDDAAAAGRARVALDLFTRRRGDFPTVAHPNPERHRRREARERERNAAASRSRCGRMCGDGRVRHQVRGHGRRRESRASRTPAR